MSEAEERAHYEIERPLAAVLRSASREARQTLYAEIYSQYRAQIAANPLIERRDAQAANVGAQLDLIRPFLRPDSTLLEIGAGDGALAARAAPYIAKAIALDVTDAIAVTGGANFEFRVFDGFDLRVPDGSVDLAFSNDVIEHLHPDDALAHLRAVRASLTPGGLYLCVTPNRLWGPHDVSRRFSETPAGFHLREYTTSELAALMLGADFGKVRVFLSRHGRHMSPLLPAATAAPLERAFALLPRSTRLRIGVLLAAIKVIAAR